MNGCLTCNITQSSLELCKSRKVPWSLRIPSLEQRDGVRYAIKEKMAKEEVNS